MEVACVPQESMKKYLPLVFCWEGGCHCLLVSLYSGPLNPRCQSLSLHLHYVSLSDALLRRLSHWYWWGLGEPQGRQEQ